MTSIPSINVVNVNNDWIGFNRVILGNEGCIKKFKNISIRIVLKKEFDVKRIIVRNGVIIIVCEWES